jgi:uncharacterized protein YjgD (DUF1641 family)
VSTVAVPDTIEGQLERISQQLAELSAEQQRQAARQQVLSELLADVSPITAEVMGRLTTTLQDVDVAAYREFAAGTATVLDRVVTSFGHDDLEALGDNVVLILETVKEMTQPEIMSMLQRTAHLVGEQSDEPAVPPSMLAILRELRDPTVRRGLARMLNLLRSVGDDGTGPA